MQLLESKLSAEPAQAASAAPQKQERNSEDYQVNYLKHTNNYRSVPDVSFNANIKTGVAVYCSNSGGWNVNAGTSFAAPAWSAILALVNEGSKNKLA